MNKKFIEAFSGQIPASTFDNLSRNYRSLSRNEKLNVKAIKQEKDQFSEPYHGQEKASIKNCLKRTVRRAGIHVGGKDYFSDAMIDRLGQPVLVKILKCDELIAFFSTNGITLGTGQPADFKPLMSSGCQNHQESGKGLARKSYEETNTTKHSEESLQFRSTQRNR